MSRTQGTATATGRRRAGQTRSAAQRQAAAAAAAGSHRQGELFFSMVPADRAREHDPLVLDDGAEEDLPEPVLGDVDEPDPEPSWFELSAEAAYRVRPEIYLYLGRHGADWDVRAPAPTGDPETDLARERTYEWLCRTAATLAASQGEAIRQPTLASAFDHLRPMQAKEIAALSRESGGDDGAEISRATHRLVGLPIGVVPLAFFSWRQRKTLGAERIVTSLWEGGSGALSGAAEHELRAAVARQVGVQQDSVDKHARAVRVLRSEWAVVQRHQRLWPHTDADRLRVDLGLPGRTQTACRLAVIGRLAAPVATSPAGSPLPQPGVLP